MDVHQDWEMVRAKFLFKKLNLPPPEDTGVVTAFRDGEVTLRENRRTEGFTFATKEIGYQGVRPGDLVIHAMDAFAGAVGVSDSFGKCSPVYSVCEPRRNLDVRYYAYLLRDFALSGRIQSLTQGIRERSTDFRFNVFGELRLPYFDVRHQQAIADFLDRETTKIDTLIEKKQRLLELLDEKRTALITGAVTRGLDPDVPMKDSGVEWIGEVPEHWDTTTLRRIARVVDCKHRTPNYVSEGYPLVSTTEVKPGVLDLSVCTRFVGKDDFADMTEGPRMPQRGDIVYSRNASLGAAALVEADESFCMGQDVVIIRAKENPDFLRHQLNSPVVTSQVEAVGVGSTFSRINVATIRDLQIAVPPFDEQRRIAEYLRSVGSELRRAATKIGKAISLFEEHRTALISAAVTGKLDVRRSRHGPRQLGLGGGETKRGQPIVDEV